MGQNNNGYRRPNFSGSQNFGVPSNSSLAPVPATQPKSKKKHLIIIVVIATVLGILLICVAMSTKSKTSKIESAEIEFLDNIKSLGSELSYTFNSYDSKIGMTPNINKNNDILPFYGYEEIISDIENSKELYEIIKQFDEQKSGFSTESKGKIVELKEKIADILGVMEYNIEYLLNFKQLYYDNFEQIMSVEDCSKLQETTNKNEIKNEAQAKLINEYGNSLCNIVRINNVSVNTYSPQSMMALSELDMQEIETYQQIIDKSDIKNVLDSINSELKSCNYCSEIEELIEEIIEEGRYASKE